MRWAAIVRLLRGSGALAVVTAVGCSTGPSGPRYIENLGWITVTPDYVTLPEAPSIFIDGFRELTATVYDREGEVIPDVTLTWTSNDRDVASISSSGMVSGEAPGTATITAAVGRQAAATASVSVVEQPDSVIIIAHRGFLRVFPENTLVAISGAFDLHADAVEVDVRWTRDAVPVLLHDATVDRTTNGTGLVGGLTYGQVQALDACAKFNSALGPCAVPSLQSALDAARGRGRLLLHLYGPFPPDALPSLLADIDRAAMRHAVVLISFDYSVLRELRRLDPVMPLGYLTTELPHMSDVLALRRTAAMPLQAAMLSDLGRARSFMQSAGANRVAVGTWVASGTSDARALVSLGVRYLLSDVPLSKRELLQ